MGLYIFQTLCSVAYLAFPSKKSKAYHRQEVILAMIYSICIAFQLETTPSAFISPLSI